MSYVCFIKILIIVKIYVKHAFAPFLSFEQAIKYFIIVNRYV